LSQLALNRDSARLQRQLQVMFRQQARELLSRLNVNTLVGAPLPFDLNHWVGPMVQVSEPLMLRAFVVGMAQSRQRIAKLIKQKPMQKGLVNHAPGVKSRVVAPVIPCRVHGGGHADARGGVVLKSSPESPEPGPEWRQAFPWVNQEVSGEIEQQHGRPRRLGSGQTAAGTMTGVGRFTSRFDLHNPRVRAAVSAATLTFCKETNDTAVGELHQALASLRTQMNQGLERGEALRTLAARVLRIFADPYRAHRIAATESKRALEGGSLLAARESGLVSKRRWLASFDACQECLALNGHEVGLEEPFVVLPRGGPYGTIHYPPYHPFCFCTTTEVL